MPVVFPVICGINATHERGRSWRQKAHIGGDAIVLPIRVAGQRAGVGHRRPGDGLFRDHLFQATAGPANARPNFERAVLIRKSRIPVVFFLSAIKIAAGAGLTIKSPR